MNDKKLPTQKCSPTLRVLSILETVVKSPKPISAKEISKVLGVPKSTIHRLCAMLEEQHFLQPRLGEAGYTPGSRLMDMVTGSFSNADQWNSGRKEVLKRLSVDLGETCNICVPGGNEMIYLDRVETHWPLRVNLNINDRVPIVLYLGG